mgnify:CR=1 FL=1
MSRYLMTYRGDAGLRLLPIIAPTLDAAWACAFDLAEQLAGPDGAVRGFCLRRMPGGAA